MDFGTLNTQEDAFAVLDVFLEADGNLIHTANVYGAGLSEEVIGNWLAARPREVTDRVVLTTKGRNSIDPDINGPGVSRRSLTRELDASPRRLGREHIDPYQAACLPVDRS